MNNAMIWGANGGIGKALIRILKEEGWNPITVSRAPEELTDMSPLALEADVGDPSSVEHAVYAVAQEVDQIQLWIYSIGDIASAPIASLDPMDWSRILNANLSGAYLATHYSLPLLAPRMPILCTWERSASACACRAWAPMRLPKPDWRLSPRR